MILCLVLWPVCLKRGLEYFSPYVKSFSKGLLQSFNGFSSSPSKDIEKLSILAEAVQVGGTLPFFDTVLHITNDLWTLYEKPNVVVKT